MLLLYPIPNLLKFLNPNHVLNTLIPPGCLLINAHLRHISTNHNHCSFFVILIFIPQTSRFQKEPTRSRTSFNNSPSSCLKTISKTLMRKRRNYQKILKKCLQYSQIILTNQIILTLYHPDQPRRVGRDDIVVIWFELLIWSESTANIVFKSSDNFVIFSSESCL